MWIKSNRTLFYFVFNLEFMIIEIILPFVFVQIMGMLIPSLRICPGGGGGHSHTQGLRDDQSNRVSFLKARSALIGYQNHHVCSLRVLIMTKFLTPAK